MWSELATDGVAGDRVLRNRLAQKLIAFACQGRADSQAKELLLSTFRNETLAAAPCRTCAGKAVVCGLKRNRLAKSPINERLAGTDVWRPAFGRVIVLRRS